MIREKFQNDEMPKTTNIFIHDISRSINKSSFESQSIDDTFLYHYVCFITLLSKFFMMETVILKNILSNHQSVNLITKITFKIVFLCLNIKLWIKICFWYEFWIDEKLSTSFSLFFFENALFYNFSNLSILKKI